MQSLQQRVFGRVCYIEIKEEVNSALDRQRTVMRKLLRLDESMLQRVSDVSEVNQPSSAIVKRFKVFQLTICGLVMLHYAYLLG